MLFYEMRYNGSSTESIDLPCLQTEPNSNKLKDIIGFTFYEYMCVPHLKKQDA